MATPLQRPVRAPDPDGPEQQLDLSDCRLGMERAPAQAKGSRMLRAVKHTVLVAAVIAVVAAGVRTWRYLATFETTDDAQVDGHLHPVSARISGTIIRVNPEVENSHFVEAGTVIAEVDPADFEAERNRAGADYARLQAAASAAEKEIIVIESGTRARLELAKAAVEEAGHSVASEKASLQAAEARLAQMKTHFNRAEADRGRYERLLASHEIAQSEYDRVAAEASANREAVTAARAEIAAGQKRIAQAQSRLAERRADLVAAGSAPHQVASSRARADAALSEVDRAKAQLTAAELNLSYTQIVAPVSGIIGRKSVEAGQRVEPGEQLLTIIPLDEIWITANFKETQLRKMRPGQAVTVHADASGGDYRGHIDAIGGATGSRFSLLPPENATGNYVKVVQRVPTRILLEAGQNADHRLRPGMSVEAKVSLR